MLGIGMCFCLRRANRLIPNQFSFPLRPTNLSPTRRRRGYDASDEEQGDPDSTRGLLSEDYDYEDLEGGEERDTRYHAGRRSLDQISTNDHQEEEFGAMQSASSNTQPPAATSSATASSTQEARAAIFKVEDDDDDDNEEVNDDNTNTAHPERADDKKKLL